MVVGLSYRNKQYIKPDSNNRDEWFESKKHISDKVKEEFNLYYVFEEDYLQFPDGRKIEANRFPYMLEWKLTKEERAKLHDLLLAHAENRPQEAAIFFHRLNNPR